MGGIYQDKKKNTSCLQIDVNMSVLEKEPMPKGPRYNLAVSLLIDKHIFCIGGIDAASDFSLSLCEVYDT